MNIVDYIPGGLSPEALALLLTGLSAGLIVLAIWQTLLVRDPQAARIKSLAERRAALKAGLTAAPQRRQKQVRGLGFMRNVVARFSLVRTRQADKVQVRLARAGFRSKDAPIIFMFCKLLMPMAFGAAAVVVIYVLQMVELKPMMRLVAMVGSVIVGFYAPDIFVKNLTDKRKKALRKGLPDSLDLLVICAEAGLGMDAAFSRVAREMARSSPEVADELSLTSIELSFLPERRQALENLNARTNMPEFRGVVNTLLQTEKYGTPLAQSLRVLAGEYRTDRLMRAEEKAARLPAIMTVPMIIFILPVLFVVLMGPAILRIIDALGRML